MISVKKGSKECSQGAIKLPHPYLLKRTTLIKATMRGEKNES
ncbi:MAG: hypothetical protein WCA08_10810 [Desulfoferrobacter sp.]